MVNSLIESFLKQIEVKAFKMALMATKSEADALDLVQNAMMKLVEKYASKPEPELKPLFYAILQNQIKNWFRKESQTAKWMFWQKSAYDEESQEEVIEQGVNEQTPELATIQMQDSAKLVETLQQLPVKQQQCFLLRSWEGLSVKETAMVMQCTEGTVKTHMSRASRKLQAILSQQELVA